MHFTNFKRDSFLSPADLTDPGPTWWRAGCGGADILIMNYDDDL
jgi:hypothetical protein